MVGVINPAADGKQTLDLFKNASIALKALPTVSLHWSHHLSDWLLTANSAICWR